MREVGNLLKECLPKHHRRMKSHPDIHCLKFMGIYQGWHTITLGSAAFFIFKVYWNTAMPTPYALSMHVCFHATMVELSNCDRECMAYKPNTYKEYYHC